MAHYAHVYAPVVRPLVLAEPGGVHVGNAQQGIGGDIAGVAVGDHLVAASFDKMGPGADCCLFLGCRGADSGEHVVPNARILETVYPDRWFYRASAGRRRRCVVLSLQGDAYRLDLAFVYPQWHIQSDDLLWWLPLLAAVVVTAVLWCYRKRWSRPFLFAWGFFCVALVPVMGFTDVDFMKYSLVADHYQHIAIICCNCFGGGGLKQHGISGRWKVCTV